MPSCTVSEVFDDVRALLGDIQIPGGELFTNQFLPPHFAEPYRSMFSKLLGSSARVFRVVGIVLPPLTTVVIPTNYAIEDLQEPEMIEERPAPRGIPVASTSATTPITVTTVAPHLMNSGTEGWLSGVGGTYAPWGNWFTIVTSPTTFTLNGSATDGVIGTGGTFYPENQQSWMETFPADLMAAGLDGVPQLALGVYMWYNNRLVFRGAVIPIQLRISYYASGTAPTNVNTDIGIDAVRDFLAYATAANAARSKGWDYQFETLRNRAYGDPQRPLDDTSLLDLFWRGQVLAAQRGPARRQQPFRARRARYGTYLLG